MGSLAEDLVVIYAMVAGLARASNPVVLAADHRVDMIGGRDLRALDGVSATLLD